MRRKNKGVLTIKPIDTGLIVAEKDGATEINLDFGGDKIKLPSNEVKYFNKKHRTVSGNLLVIFLGYHTPFSSTGYLVIQYSVIRSDGSTGGRIFKFRRINGVNQQIR